jgi:glucose/arabinose dehydrogenase
VNVQLLVATVLLAFPVINFAQPRLVPNKISLINGKTFSLNVADGFEIIPALEGLKRVRFFAKAPDGRIFVTDMYNLADNKRGTVYILDGWDAKTGKFARAVPYMTNLRNPNSVQFYRDAKGQEWFYLAETHQLTRRRFTRGETKPTDTQPEVLATFPDYGLSYKYGGWHLTRTISFSPGGKLYVSVGSSCNACVEKEKVRASIIEMNPDGTGQRELARGLRNAVGLRAIGNYVFATNQGSDHLGLQKPDETFYAIKDGADYGWPYCHSSNGKIFADPTFKRPGQCSKVEAPYAYFPARSSALGFDYFNDEDADETIKNAFLVALHGSTNKDIGHGYQVVIMRKGERLQPFMTGFLSGRTVNGRPCDVMKLDANSFLLTDDFSGIVYLVRKKGTSTHIAETVDAPAESQSPVIANSEQAPSKACLSVVLLLGATLLKALS